MVKGSDIVRSPRYTQSTRYRGGRGWKVSPYLSSTICECVVVVLVSPHGR